MQALRHLTVLLITAVVTTSATCAAEVPRNGRLDFVVTRNGSPIGQHHVNFAERPGGVEVAIQTDIAVRVPLIGIALYRFEHQGREAWQDNRLVHLASRTNDNGTTKSVAASGKDGVLQVDGSAANWSSTEPIIPASLWNADLVTQTALLNTLDGSRMAVTVRYVGEEQVEAAGRPTAARHYVIDGQLKREVWYDANRRLVMVRFKADDDSDIRYLLQ